ncbi:hypothetical protein GALL_290710 [mine drainage metagenome]|uniref:DUF2946 family protein n=1 Tax=mine drainage metagenome TaxID=410659 RepID=A0A1J5RLL4_9ZZZZ
MDDSVRRALLRWPDVPACTGWLGLDDRGDWWLRSAAAQPWPRTDDGRWQRDGATRLQHAGLIGFIARNYLAADSGYWYFQNGPQRVYVELDAAPLVLRLQPDGGWLTHTGVACTPRAAWLDEAGRLYLETAAGPGIVHGHDLAALGAWIDDALQRLCQPGREPLALQPLGAATPAQQLGFRLSPSADAAL